MITVKEMEALQMYLTIRTILPQFKLIGRNKACG